jgi:hypothetical protein
MYGKHDGVILKRLLSAFSFRPTAITNTASRNNNPYKSFNPTVSNVPMINLRLPSIPDKNEQLSLNKALEHSQTFMEDGSFIERNNTVLYSRNILIFYLDRKSQMLKLGDEEELLFNKLPAAISGFDRINDINVDFSFEMTLKDSEDIFELRSAVIAELDNTMGSDTNLSVGSSTVVLQQPDKSNHFMNREAYVYDPYNVTRRVISNNQIIKNEPVSWVPLVNDGSNIESFHTMARKKGLIFIYQKK